MPVDILTDSVCSPTGAIRYAINIKKVGNDGVVLSAFFIFSRCRESVGRRTHGNV